MVWPSIIPPAASAGTVDQRCLPRKMPLTVDLAGPQMPFQFLQRPQSQIAPLRFRDFEIYYVDDLALCAAKEFCRQLSNE